MILYFNPDRADAWVEVSPTGEPLTERQIKEAVLSAPEDAVLYTRSTIAFDAARLRYIKNLGMDLKIVTTDQTFVLDDEGLPTPGWDWKEEITMEILGEIAKVRRSRHKSLVQKPPTAP